MSRQVLVLSPSGWENTNVISIQGLLATKDISSGSSRPKIVVFDSKKSLFAEGDSGGGRVSRGEDGEVGVKDKN